MEKIGRESIKTINSSVMSNFLLSYQEEKQIRGAHWGDNYGQVYFKPLKAEEIAHLQNAFQFSI